MDDFVDKFRENFETTCGKFVEKFRDNFRNIFWDNFVFNLSNNLSGRHHLAVIQVKNLVSIAQSTGLKNILVLFFVLQDR